MADWRGVATVLSMFSTLPNLPIPPTVPTFASIGDPEGTRTVTSIVALLVALGLALLLVAVWLHRTTRPDPELLAPLEAMGERKWRRGDPVWQRRRLDELRPQGASPLEPSVAPPELDESFDAGPTASGFDDLRAPVAPGRSSDDRDDADDEMPPDAAPPVAPPTAPPVAPPAAPRPVSGASSTPVDLVRPDLDDLSDDFDADALAAAREELERELAEGARRRSDERSYEWSNDPSDDRA